MSDAADTEVIGAVRAFLAREFPKRADAVARLSVDDALADLGVLDSLGVITLATFLEMKWSVKVPSRTFKASFRTLRDVEATVERLRPAR